MHKYTRRHFIRASGTALTAAAVTPAFALSASKSPPSDTLSIGLIGCRSMGYWLMYHALNQEGVVCGGLCDVDRNILAERSADVEEKTGRRPAHYADYRAMLEDDDLDAVIVATPDHWHCLQTVHALEAGKHVYVEKPLANSIAEGEIMTKAARRFGRIVQVGQQQRSGDHWQEVVSVVRSGGLGRIRQVRLWGNFAYGKGRERVPDEPVPEGVDYDMWLGPAPERPFNRNRFHGFWRFHWDYGGGLITDWGTHLLDIPLWALNIEGPPRSVSSIGGIYSGEDRAIETADTQTVIYQFDDFNMVWEHCGGLETGPYGRNYGIAFVGNAGTLVVNRAGWEIVPETEDDRPLVDAVPFRKGVDGNHGPHVADFLNCIRSGAEPVCSVDAGNLAAFYGHIGNISHRTNRRLEWDDEGQLIDRDRFAHLITPAYREPWKLPPL